MPLTTVKQDKTKRVTTINSARFGPGYGNIDVFALPVDVSHKNISIFAFHLALTECDKTKISYMKHALKCEIFSSHKKEYFRHFAV
jgi:hypothetical protein